MAHKVIAMQQKAQLLAWSMPSEKHLAALRQSGKGCKKQLDERFSKAS